MPAVLRQGRLCHSSGDVACIIPKTVLSSLIGSAKQLLAAFSPLVPAVAHHVHHTTVRRVQQPLHVPPSSHDDAIPQTAAERRSAAQSEGIDTMDHHLVLAKCGTNGKTRGHVSCAGRNRTAPLLFVVVAHLHLRDERGAALLNDSLHAIRCHHPHDPILVVDNDSPRDVESVLQGELEALQSHIGHTGGGGHVAVTRRSPGWNVHTAWQAADEVLHHPQRRRGLGFGADIANISQVVFLQHSMKLCQPIPPPRPGCAAQALSGFIGLDAEKRKYFTAKLGWVTQLSSYSRRCMVAPRTDLREPT